MANFLESNITKLRIGARTNGNYIPDVNSPELLVDGTGNITTANINTGNIEIINGKTINIKDTNSNNVLVMNATSFTAYDNITIDANNVDIDKVLRIKRNNSLQDINTIITNEREAAKSYADGKVSDEASARATADTNLGNRITQEINDRSAAITTEAAARSAAIEATKTLLQGNINSEANTRASEDSNLLTQINTMKNGNVSGTLRYLINENTANIDKRKFVSPENSKYSNSNVSYLDYRKIQLGDTTCKFSPAGIGMSSQHLIMVVGNYIFEVDYKKDITYSSINGKDWVQFNYNFAEKAPSVFVQAQHTGNKTNAVEVRTLVSGIDKSGFYLHRSAPSGGDASSSNTSFSYFAISIW